MMSRRIMFRLMNTVAIVFVFLSFLSCGNHTTNRLRPTLKTLTHDPDKKFVGHDGIKELSEKHLGMRYLYKPELTVDELKNRTKADLTNPDKFKRNEEKYSQQVSDSYLADVYVKFIDDKIGYGLFANSDIEKGALIGEYTGIILDSSSLKDSTWAWSYPIHLYKDRLPKSSLDAKNAGGAMRFANDNTDPNAGVEYIFLDGLVRILYVAKVDIKKEEQIFVSYGSGYWENRTKQDL